MKEDSAADDIVALMVAQFGDLADTLRDAARQHGNGERSLIEAALPAEGPVRESLQTPAKNADLTAAEQGASELAGLETEAGRRFEQLCVALETAASTLSRAQREAQPEPRIAPDGSSIADDSPAPWSYRIEGMFSALFELCRMADRPDLAERFQRVRAQINREN